MHAPLTRRAFSLGALAWCAGAGAQPVPESAESTDAPETLETPEAPPDAPPVSRPYADHEKALLWAEETARARGLDAAWAREVIASAWFNPDVQRLMRPAAYNQASSAARNWRAYRKRFLTPVHLQAGARFWQANRPALARAEAQFGVPAAVIVGILGVETIYGRNMGRFRVLDALATLAFDFPQEHPRARQRQVFFARELAHFLVLCQRNQLLPGQPEGSYAGAMGLPQFMPSSWLQYAVDFDGDGRIDLWGSAADAIGSVANYFRAFGWRPGLPTHYAARLQPQADMRALLAHDILPTFSPASLAAQGVLMPEQAQEHDGPLALIELQNGDASEPGNEPLYVAGTENFYAITRYNWSAYYAMAVIELGQQVAEKMDGKTSGKTVAKTGAKAATKSVAKPARKPGKSARK